MIERKTCPLCDSSLIAPVLEATDYTVSHESFSIWHCNQCTLRFTQHAPGPEEVAPYYQSESYISHSDTSKGFINRIYHRVRKNTLQKKLQLVIRNTGRKSGKLLDIGAGTGAFAQVVQSAGWTVTALEPDATARKRAQEAYQLQLLEPEALFSFAAAAFDAITMWHVLEHVHQLHEYLHRIKELLSPDGRAFIAVPNYTSYDERIYGKYWAAYDVPRHLYHFSPASMRVLLEQHGLELVTIRPMWYDSFYISMLSEKYKTRGNRLPAAVWNGTMSNLTALFNTERCSSVIYIIRRKA